MESDLVGEGVESELVGEAVEPAIVGEGVGEDVEPEEGVGEDVEPEMVGDMVVTTVGLKVDVLELTPGVGFPVGSDEPESESH